MLRLCLTCARACARQAARFALWTAWLLLAALLAGQAAVISSNRIQVPDFLLRIFERRLEADGLSFAFGRATFDQGGRILVENARLSLATFGEPVATARALYIRIDPWALAAGRVEPSEFRATGVDLLVPAMLSASGTPERIIRDLDCRITPGRTGLSVDYLTGWLGPVAVAARGTVHIPEAGPAGAGGAPRPAAALIASNYGRMSRQLADAIQKVAGLDTPRLQVVLTPSNTRAAIAALTLTARGYDGGSGVPVRLSGLRVSTRLPLLGDTPIMALLAASADEAVVPAHVSLHGIRARVRGMLDRTRPSFELSTGDVWAVDGVRDDMTLRSPFLHVASGAQPGLLSVEALGELLGGAVSASGEVDPRRGGGSLRVRARVTPDVLDAVSERVGVNVRRFLDLSSPVDVSASVRLAEGWRFTDAAGRVAADNPVIFGVRLDRVTGSFTFDGRHFRTGDAVATLGEDAARGVFEQDFVNWDYRFIADGRLRPLDISDWFPDWWPAFFGNFGFPGSAPAASVDLIGRWTSTRLTQAFAFVDAVRPTIRGVPVDEARARFFVRPQFFDALECRADVGAGTVRGSGSVTSDFDRDLWTGLDFNASSTVDPALLARMLGPDEAALAGRLAFERPPSVRASGHLDGPGAAGSRRRWVAADVAFDGGATVLGIPLRDGQARISVKDDDVNVENGRAGFAGGTLTGTLRLSGPAKARRLAVAGKLGGASLGQAASALAALMPPPAAPAPSTSTVAGGKGAGAGAGGGASSLQAFAREKAAVKVDASLDADETLGVPASLRGKGEVRLQGPELGSLPLLGGLSKLLKATALRFTSAQSSFTLEGTQVRFPDLTATGANSAIQARGTYDTGLHQLDFTAKVLPFEESHSPLQVLSFLTAPLSAILEVRLTGPVDKPSWAFVHGPQALLGGKP